MKSIKVLDKSVAELIAAGEVVERPASVVKELLENAIDAGARKIKIEIKNGGITYIKVTDNGSGILRNEVSTAFLRHATSKVLSIEDLDNIFTLGFRGEALASISAVSKVEIITRTQNEIEGTHYIISDSGEEIRYIGSPVGTTVIVKDLFFNIPARMKFLKKDVTEGNIISGIVDKLALSHPEISFTFIRDGQEKLYTAGDNNLLSAIYSVLGKDIAKMMIPLDYSINGMSVTGFISNPSQSRMSRSMQSFFVNSRFVKSKTCYTALEGAYRSFITQGKFPACVLNIKIPNSVVDVNVHPAKTEVRFSNDKMIYDLIYVGVKNCILSQTDRPIMQLSNSLSSSDHNLINEHQYSYRLNETLYGNNLDTDNTEKKDDLDISKKSDNIENNINKYEKVNKIYYSHYDVPIGNFSRTVNESKDTTSEFNNNLQLNYYDNALLDNGTVTYSIKTEKLENYRSESISETKHKNNPYENCRLVGEIFNSYIILEDINNLILIDKHAAHERIIYESIKNGNIKKNTQALITPIIIDMSYGEYQAIVENISKFADMGFILEDFGNKSVIVRGIPLEFMDLNIEDVLIDMANNYILNKGLTSTMIDKMYYSMACKAAIKAGNKNNILEIKQLIELLNDDKYINHCPHGRPISFSIMRKDIEKQFLR